MLTGRPIEVRVVGPTQISEQVIRDAPSNVTFTGRVERDQAQNEYRDADLFVLPTISDGFAITQLEAMAHGLPVITTPNCGRVVRDEVDGFLIPPRDSDALAEAIAVLDDDRSRLAEMSSAAYQSSQSFTIDQLRLNLSHALADPNMEGPSYDYSMS
jgi:glycosyltransferase involved in cell wall biosynthesis